MVPKLCFKVVDVNNREKRLNDLKTYLKNLINPDSDLALVTNAFENTWRSLFYCKDSYYV